ncbi:MAG: NAD-dependent epimerase/dehydratase family protein [Betaproteobacteria bacterium]
MRVLVLGGSGFVGRHAAAALHRRRHEVVIATRRPRRAARHLAAGLAGCRLVEAHLEWLITPHQWRALLRDVDAVVNAVGLLRERGRWESFERMHCEAPAALAGACAKRGVRLVHVSMAGLHDMAQSRFLQSRLAGERAVAASGADYSLVRPALLFGEGGFAVRWMRRIAAWPVHPVPADARGRIALLDVRDLGEALAVLCEERNNPRWREVELGGAARLTLAELLGALRQDSRPALRLKVPSLLARLASRLCDLAHATPLSEGTLELLRKDNAPQANLLPLLIGRESAPLRLLGREREVLDAAPVALRWPAL